MILDAYVVDLENFHHVQRDILNRLYVADELPYSGLKPAELTGNSFNYHLKHVVAQKLVEPTAGQAYRLTPLGRLLVDNVSLPEMRLKLRPAVGVTLLVRSEQHGILTYNSRRAPLRGWLGLPFGKLRLGDAAEATADRMLAKRGLESGAVSGRQFLGMANIRYFEQGQLVAHRLSLVLSAQYAGPAVDSETPHGSGGWLRELPATRVLAEVAAIRDWAGSQPVLEIEADLA